MMLSSRLIRRPAIFNDVKELLNVSPQAMREHFDVSVSSSPSLPLNSIKQTHLNRNHFNQTHLNKVSCKITHMVEVEVEVEEVA